MKTIVKIIFISIFSILINYSYAQDNSNDIKKLTKAADSFFDDLKYNKALFHYLKIDSLQPGNSEINYKIGACYLNSKYKKIKALPYLEIAIQDKRIQVPQIIYKDLGILYHLDYQFDNAIENFNHYLNLSGKKDKYMLLVERMINICKNAQEITKTTYDLEIENVGAPISTSNNEFSPLISADESLMFFMRIKSTKNDWKIGRFETQEDVKIMYSYNDRGSWEEPKELIIDLPEKETYIALAGLSPDGSKVFFQIGEGRKADIYYGYFAEGRIINLIKLDNVINSKYWEGRISISPMGNELYFSSDRPGGYGGKDLYKSILNDKGNWSKPINLGSIINTKYDEDAPFIHPDNMTLYFSSNGHKTIGGYDIFVSSYSENSWSTPKNLGFPNSTQDDIYFVATADGNSGYFSTFQNNLIDNHHIYRVDLKKSIPLTLVKGTILAGNPLKPIQANIKVIDKSNHKLVKYVYSPSPKSGKYLLIFPPRKNYDLIIEAEGYLPQLINIYIPNQTYFYELFQEIKLRPVTTMGSIIGEEISINNTFYDIYSTSLSDSMLTHQETDSLKDYGQLLQIIEDIINTTDSLGVELLDNQLQHSQIKKDSTIIKSNYDKLFNLIEKAIETTDSVSLSILDENTLYNEENIQRYYYSIDKDNSDLEPYIVDKDTIYTVPLISTASNDKKSVFIKSRTNLIDRHKVVIPTIKINKRKNNILLIKQSTKDNRKIILLKSVYFEHNQAIINKKYNTSLDEIAKLIINNELIGIEISGYTDTKGEDNYNLGLSRQRANNVLKYIHNIGVNTQKTIVKAYGEQKAVTEITEKEQSKNRRVDLVIFEVIK